MAKQIPLDDVWPTPALLRAARAMLAIGQEEIAKEANCARKTVILVENHLQETMDLRRVEMVRKLAVYLVGEGIEFIRPRDGKGAAVRFADPSVEAKALKRQRRKERSTDDFAAKTKKPSARPQAPRSVSSRRKSDR
jgi:DNA-binding XRE family transcriptional regulator